MLQHRARRHPESGACLIVLALLAGSVVTHAASSCTRDYGCAGGAVSAVEFCSNADGCLTGLVLHYARVGSAPLEVGCGLTAVVSASTGSSACADSGGGGARVALGGELVTSYTVERKRWGSGRCVSAVSFVMRSGAVKRVSAADVGGSSSVDGSSSSGGSVAAGSPSNPGSRRLLSGGGDAAAAAAALAATNPLRRLLQEQPRLVRPRAAPACAARDMQPDAPLAFLCGLRANSCVRSRKAGGRAISNLSPVWAYKGSSQCTVDPASIQWSCPEQLNCTAAGAIVDLAGLCTASVAGAAVSYRYAPPGGSAASEGAPAACPADDVAAVVTPVLPAAPGEPASCAAEGPAVRLVNTASFKTLPGDHVLCPDNPTVMCVAPACNAAGALVQLRGSCSSDDMSADFNYIVDNNVLSIPETKCPEAGVAVPVKVVAVYKNYGTKCPYPIVDAYTLTTVGHTP